MRVGTLPSEVAQTVIGVHVGAPGPASADVTSTGAMTPQELAKRCGLVFQFPERYFLGGTLQEVAVKAVFLEIETCLC